MWVDINGSQVTKGETLLAFDNNDHVWQIDPETGVHQGLQTVEPYYADDLCTDPLIQLLDGSDFILPGAVLATQGGDLVRPDSQAVQTDAWELDAQSNCNVVDNEQPGVPALGLDQAGAPPAEFGGPLHIEAR